MNSQRIILKAIICNENTFDEGVDTVLVKIESALISLATMNVEHGDQHTLFNNFDRFLVVADEFLVKFMTNQESFHSNEKKILEIIEKATNLLAEKEEQIIFQHLIGVLTKYDCGVVKRSLLDQLKRCSRPIIDSMLLEHLCGAKVV